MPSVAVALGCPSCLTTAHNGHTSKRGKLSLLIKQVPGTMKRPAAMKRPAFNSRRNLLKCCAKWLREPHRHFAGNGKPNGQTILARVGTVPETHMLALHTHGRSMLCVMARDQPDSVSEKRLRTAGSSCDKPLLGEHVLRSCCVTVGAGASNPLLHGGWPSA